MRRCRYRFCGKLFTPLKPNYYFCSWDCHQAHFAGNDYRGYRRSSEQSYDRGWHDAYHARTATINMLPPHIWRALAVLVHPDRWQQEPGLLALSHEAMVWLNTHRPSDPERN